MKANELIIGDWIYRPDCFDQVKEIRQNGIIGLDSARGLIPFLELEPIPLIPEILEKNGFSNKGTLWYLEEDNFELEHNNNDSFIWIVGDVYIVASIKYVHELQHALRLCGITREIII